MSIIQWWQNDAYKWSIKNGLNKNNVVIFTNKNEVNAEIKKNNTLKCKYFKLKNYNFLTLNSL